MVGSKELLVMAIIAYVLAIGPFCLYLFRLRRVVGIYPVFSNGPHPDLLWLAMLPFIGLLVLAGWLWRVRQSMLPLETDKQRELDTTFRAGILCSLLILLATLLLVSGMVLLSAPVALFTLPLFFSHFQHISTLSTAAA